MKSFVPSAPGQLFCCSIQTDISAASQLMQIHFSSIKIESYIHKSDKVYSIHL